MIQVVIGHITIERNALSPENGKGGRGAQKWTCVLVGGWNETLYDVI